ncbi:MAG TPA: glycosyltransferase [Thermoanaerobaculaceae bacterium]|nr:glycosyltransferase [Thermoanaerobaculaceae bacterium]
MLLVNPVSERSGSSASLLTLVRGLASASEWDIHVALPESGWLASRLAEIGVATHLIQHPRLSSRLGLGGRLRYLLRFRAAAAAFGRLCDAVRPDLVHCNSTVSPFALLAARRRGIPAVVHCREVPDNRFVRGLLWRFVATHAAAVIANSRFTASSFPNPARVRVVYNGFEFPPAPPGPAGAKRIAVVGRLSADKGADHALLAFVRVARDEPDARLDVVGGAVPGHESFLDRVERLAADEPLRGRVTLLGEQEDVGASLRKADLLLHLPRFREPFGRVIVEAAALALPAVAFACGGIPEIVDDGRSGFLVQHGDLDGAADRCLRLLRDREIAARMGAEARRSAEQRFPVDAYVEGVTAVYRSILAAGR